MHSLILFVPLYHQQQSGYKTSTNMKTYPKHITDHANKMIALGTKMSFEAICDLKMKGEAKKEKKAGSKKEIEKALSRKRVEEMDRPSIDEVEEMRLQSIRNQRPSSLR